jgi:AraC-like DNA-binding protein
LYQRQLKRLIIPAFRAKILSEVLTEAGISHQPPAVEEPDPSMANATIMIAADREVEFQRSFAHLTSDRPDLWFAAGLRQTPLTFGLHGAAAMSAPTMRDVWLMVEETHEISISFNIYRPLREGSHFVGVELDESELPSDLRAYTLYMELGSLIATVRQLSVGTVAVNRVEWPFPRMADSSFLDPFGLDIAFDKPRMRVFWPDGAADQPMIQGHALLHRHYVDRCRHMAEAVRAQDLVARIETVIANDALELPTVARRLNLSERTLQRRLKEAGLNFRAVSNDARMKRARKLLSEGTTSIADVAARLGYAETASFTHAFQRLSGCTPRQFRRDTLSGHNGGSGSDGDGGSPTDRRYLSKMD